MFFILSKILLFLIAPITWIITFILLSLFSCKPARRIKFLRASVILLLFFSNTFIFDRFMHAWEVKAFSDDSAMQFDGAIILTGMTTYDPEIKRLEFNDRTDRLMQALKIYGEKKAAKIILCGGPATVSGNDTMEAPLLKKFIENLGVPEADIIVESFSRNTHENAIYMKPLLNKLNPTGKYLLVTSAWHMRRAMACFLKERLSVIPYSTDRYSGKIKYEIDYLLIPSSSTLFNWEKLIHEWVGCIVYYFKGYI